MNSDTFTDKLLNLLAKTDINRLEDPPEGVPRYTINKIPYFSVTQILDDGRFSGVDSIRMFHAKILGSVVHNFIENFFKNNDLDYNQENVLRTEENEFLNQIPAADENSWEDFRRGLLTESEELFLKNKIQTAFDYFMNFIEENEVELIISEEPIWSPKFLYAGTIDLICKLNGHLALVDHKTSKFIKTVPKGFDPYTAQLSAYHFALKDLISTEIESECYLLHLNPFANDYQIIRRSYNFSMFLDALSVFSGGKPSNDYYIDINGNNKEHPEIDLSSEIEKNENIKELKFQCTETSCKEPSLFNLKTVDLNLSNQNIPIISKCTFHETGNHYQILHLDTENWKAKKSFNWAKEQ